MVKVALQKVDQLLDVHSLLDGGEFPLQTSVCWGLLECEETGGRALHR